MSTTDTVLGVVSLSRHGDRQGFYQSAVTYSPSDTAITPLGEVQEYQLGQLIRSRYFTNTSTSVIPSLATELVDNTKISLYADAGGEGSVIFDSAIALSQGLFPATTTSSTTLANGTTVTSPLGGYQYVSVASISPDDDYSVEGWTECPKFAAANTAFYSSDEFKQVASDNAAFLQSLIPIVGGRNVTLANMYNIFDYINVQYIHNETFANSITPQIREQARALANYHEYGVFSGSYRGDIDNIAGQAILPSVMHALNSFTNTSTPIKYVGYSISYKPFISLFKMTNVSDTNTGLQGIVDYAASMVFEVRQPASGDPYVQFGFKNGTNDADYAYYNLFGNSGATTLSEFNSTLAPYGISTLAQWCNTCGNTQDRGCDVIAAANETYGTATKAPGQQTSPLAAGFIGACVTLFIMLLALAALFFTGALGLGAKRRRNKTSSYALRDDMDSNSIESRRRLHK